MIEKIKLNKVILILILSDLTLLIGLGFITPIFSIFLTENIQGGNVEVAGFASAIYWIIEAVAMIPLGKYLDKHTGERDDLFFIVIGNFLAALSVLGYLQAKLPWHIYVLQSLYAFGMAMNVPGYTAVFTRHIDKGMEALSWSLRGSLVALGSGVAGALGGIIAKNFGFNILFIGAAVFILLSSFLPLFILRAMKRRGKNISQIPEIKDLQPPAPKL
jgi:MFS family permease